eukprot:scaffold98808_cov69-Phaeocystis_antarctica.AAC.14
MAVRPWILACARAVRPFLSSSSVLALARSSARTHAPCPCSAAAIRAVTPRMDCRSRLAECSKRTSRMERLPQYAALMSAVVPNLLAAACSRAAVWGDRARRPTLGAAGIELNASTGPPLRSHLTTSCSLPRSADSSISSGSEAGELTAGSPASGEAAGGAAAAGGGGAACCRMSSGGGAVVVDQLGVGLGSQQGLHACLVPIVSGLHQGGDAPDVLQVRVGRVLQQDEHGGEVALARCIHERGEAVAAWQVDARASLQQLPHHLQLAVDYGGVQQAVGCGGLTNYIWKRAKRVDQSSLANPLGHLLQLASRGRVVELEGQRGGSAHRGLTSIRWGGRRGGGRLRWRCELPDEIRDGRVALGFGLLQDGVAVFVEQLGVGLGSQQGLHARLVPCANRPHQDGDADIVLQVGVRRVLQEDEHGGEVAPVCSSHERGAAETVWQVDARASHQQLPHHLQLAVDYGGVQQGFECGPTAECGRAERVDQPSFAQPPDHLLQLAPLRRPVDLFGKWGGRAHRRSASLSSVDKADSGGPVCERAVVRARRCTRGRPTGKPSRVW